MTRREALLAFLFFCAKRSGAASDSPAILSGRVLDRATGRPVSCALTIRTKAGPILDEHQRFSPSVLRTGEFRFLVAPGEVWVTVSRGYDYQAETRKIVLRPGQEVKLSFSLKRVSPLRERGWLCGDSHIHMAHGERAIPVTFSDVALAGRAGGLDYLSLCQHWNVEHAQSDVLERAGAAESGPDFQMTWNVEAPKNYFLGDVSHCLGHGWTLALQGGKDVIPEVLQLSAWDYEKEKKPVPNFEIHALIHRLGGIVSYSHPCRWWRGKWGGASGYAVEENKFISNLAQELPFDTVAGPTYDTLDVLMQAREDVANRNALRLWFEMLNHGYRIAATASSDSTFDNPRGGTPGASRVYTRLEEGFSWERIARAMKAGRNFVTTGPMVEFRLNGRGPGESVNTPLLKADLSAWASGDPGESLTKIQVIWNGEEIRAFTPSRGRKKFRARFSFHAPSGNGWCVVVCEGHGAGRMAVTNPIYFSAAGEEHVPPAPAAATVEAAAHDAHSGKPLNGECEVLRMIGATAEVISKAKFEEGQIRTAVPATSRLRVNAPGYAPLTRSVFLDDAAILDLTLNLRADTLTDWSTFEKIRSLLGKVRLDFPLERG